MASIQKTAKGYRAQIKVLGVRDSQLFRTKREAEGWAAQRETEIRERANQSPAVRHTLRDALKRYLEEETPRKRSAAWEAKRIQTLLKDRHLPSAERIGSVTTEMLAKWRDERGKAVRPGSVIRDISTLGSVFECARLQWKWISTNPLKDLSKPPTPDHRAVVISTRQVRAMLRAMGYTTRGEIREMRHAVAMCFLCALRTGMRAGELCGLTWDRVHDDRAVLPITKTKPRDVPLSRQAHRVIERMRGWDESLVFGLKTQSLDAQFRKYRQRAGLSGFTFHDSRHTAATMLARRLDVLDLCKMFGWSRPDMAIVYYNPTASEIARRLNHRSRAGQSR